ncbi:YopX family protein [Bacillus haynesii]|nr:YopX family protein [Bacillus haynesii]MEC0738756.1 YopX family protein [Bacillus haynesii]
MREIKFRAWNKEKEIMVYGNEDDSEEYWDGVISSDVDMVNSLLRYNPPFEYIWMQYTGLKDKNDREIYEEDITRDDDGFLWKIYWEDGSFWAKGGEFNLREQLIELAPDFCEIIGDVYRNPELLEAAE